MTDTPSQGSGSPAPGSAAPGSGQQPAAGAPSPQSGSGQQQQPRPAENPNTRGVSPARDAREAAAARQPGQQPGAEQQSDQQPGQQQSDAGDEAEVQVGKIKITPKRLSEIMERQGAEDARKLTLPASPDAYELKTSESFKPPAGVTFEFNKDDPVLAQARQLAHARGMDQQTFSDFLDVYASDRIREMTKINTARNAEIARLGTMAPQRIDAIKTFLHGTLGSELGGALEMMLCTERQVRGFEKIIERVSRQGGTPFSQGHREGEPPKGKIPGYANMSFEQKRAAQMSQNPPAQRTTREIR
jgi:hypothetical protein